MLERGLVAWNIYQRIRYFGRLYPLRAFVRELVDWPLDYWWGRRPIRAVRNVTLAITHQCNLRCSMCYFHQELGDRLFLPLDTYRSFIDQVAASRPGVILSGGEPLVHPGLGEMVAHAKSRRLPVQIFTNGLLATPERILPLRDSGLDYLNVTLLGDADGHDRIANCPGAHDRLIENLALLAPQRGRMRLILNYTLTPQACQGLPYALELVRRLRLDGLRIQHYNVLLPWEYEAQQRLFPQGDGAESGGVNEIVTTGEELTAMGEQVLTFLKDPRFSLQDPPIQWAPNLTPHEVGQWYSTNPFQTTRVCLFAWRGMLLDADGQLYPCSKIYHPLGEGGTDPIRVWNGPEMERFRQRLRKGLFPACSRCCKL